MSTDLEKAALFARKIGKKRATLQSFIEELAKIPEGRENFESILGLQIAHQPDLSNRPLVALCVPAYRGMHPRMQDAVRAMFAYSRQFCDLMESPSLGSSVVHWSRNELVTACYVSGNPFTHVLFVDDDIIPEQDALIRMLRHDKPIVAAVCSRRTDPPVPNVREYDPATCDFRQWLDLDASLAKAVRGELTPEQALRPFVGLGTGMMLIKREVLDRVAEYYINCEYEKAIYGATDEWIEEATANRRKIFDETKKALWFNFTPHPKGKGEYGEDIGFTWKVKQCGFETFADLSVLPGHMGDYGYSVKDYLPYRDHEIAKGIAEGWLQPLKAGEDKTKISLLVPTRGRPENVERLIKSLQETSAVMPEVVLYVDLDDEKMIDWQRPAGVDVKFVTGPRITLSECWNKCLEVATGDILMHAGDDIVFKTKGWDDMVRRAFAAYSDRILFVHGDDGYWGNRFGTHGFIHRKWVETVGYFVPPYFSSDFNDTWLNEVANAIGRRLYLPFVTEHMHFLFGKGEKDQTHIDRLERHKKDEVEKLYNELAPKRVEDAERLLRVINSKELVTA
jgi:hypothetical protein